ncbi:zinc finger BED domain-containing protein RICESLEEPER 2-like [Quillaja saponaria]|uniref:Zinc finger BED domain-containing protein RICESLEEPER 2-like n=1 Tax=Quillaja saponaria TaxID=32244 RepID=A0AAD7VDP9_QUISA|nr:zinc finger BED domain-containing protein RICESLEEPER 2-like [Quillaja saponaria]
MLSYGELSHGFSEGSSPVASHQPNAIDDINDHVDVDENEIDSTLPSQKRKKTSDAWNHFQKKKIDGEYCAICNYCQKKLSGKSANGTNHLLRHVNSCPERKEANKEPNKTEKQKEIPFDQEKSRMDLAKMIIVHGYPLSMVDYVGFRKFIHGLQPAFKMVSRNTVKADIMKIYDYEKDNTLKLIKSSQSKVALTCDMWTASNQRKGFMAITAHFIDLSWSLQSRLLRFVYVPCPHANEVLCDVLVDCIIDWNIDKNISTITLDNCSTNDALIDTLKSNLNLSSFILNGDLLHMRCAAYILNLIVKYGLEVIKDSIERIRESVAYWTATPKREEKFEEVYRQCRVSCSKKLGLDCPTRWNSTYLMLHTALVFKDVFSRLKQREIQYKIEIKEEEWGFAKDICGKLKIFYNITELFSGTKYPTSNNFFHNVCNIRLVLKEWQASTDTKIKEMAAKSDFQV